MAKPKTHCKNGHEYTQDNVYIHGRGGGKTQRHCKVCRQVSSRRRMAEKRKRCPEYNVWTMMRSRCRDPNNQDWGLYGGRGVSVCERWDSFDTFYADMGPRPGPRWSIDRLDVNGNYEPGNCRWATPKQQARNKRNTKLTEVAVLCIRELHRRGATYGVLAKAFGVANKMVGQVCRGTVWQPDTLRVQQ